MNLHLALPQMSLEELVDLDRAGQSLSDAAMTELLTRFADGRLSADVLSAEEQAQLRSIMAAARTDGGERRVPLSQDSAPTLAAMRSSSHTLGTPATVRTP